jgi:hypothetical protein
MPERETEYSFTIKRIVLLEKTFSIRPPILKDEEFAFDVSLQSEGKPELQECAQVMTVKIQKKGEKNSIGTISIGCTFSIPNYQEYVLASDDKISLPEQLMQLLNAAIIGTIRGVMFSEFRGTMLGGAYLPVLDPRRFKKDDQQ